MSRFVEILNQNEREITVQSFREMLPQMTERLQAESGYVEMDFPYFVNKTARKDIPSKAIFYFTFNHTLGELTC